MTSALFFVQECPTCGRRLEVRIEYLGKRVFCQHCRAEFLASDNPSSLSLLQRAEQLIESTWTEGQLANEDGTVAFPAGSPASGR